jgi:hypothetical protein
VHWGLGREARATQDKTWPARRGLVSGLCVDGDGGGLSVCYAWTWGDWTGLDLTLKNGITLRNYITTPALPDSNWSELN